MQLEHIAAPPPAPSPKLRYAALHRTIDRGLASDRTWAELAEVCMELGREDEAASCVRMVGNPTERRSLQSRLGKQGMVPPPDLAATPPPLENAQATVRDAAIDSLRFLADDHMPLTVTVATLTFPLLVGLSGYLARTSSSMLLSSIALLPAVLVLAVIGAVARMVLIDSARGLDDAPSLPQSRELLDHCKKGLCDLGLVALLCLGPVVAAINVQLPWWSVAVSGAAGTLLMPMALALRTLRGDWQSLAPNVLLTAIFRTGSAYCGLFSAIAALLAPAWITLLATAGSELFMRIAVMGPLTVVPLLVVARVAGRFLHLHRDDIPLEPVKPTEKPTTRPKAAAKPARRRRLAPTVPQALAAAVRAAQPAPSQTAVAQQPTSPRAKPAPRAKPRKVAPPPVAPAATQRPGSSSFHNAVRPSRPSVPVAPSQSAPRPRPPQLDPDAMPDLLGMPGVSIVRGADREAAGAASQPPRQQRRPSPRRRPQ